VWRLPLARLRVLSGKQVCTILARHGFLEVQQRGSHIVMQKRLPETTLTVPVPNHDELRIGIFNRSSASRLCPGASSNHDEAPKSALKRPRTTPSTFGGASCEFIGGAVRAA
jgi:predicted RNA binding protein YcfA (HicA-like mRNA interferase family)